MSAALAGLRVLEIGEFVAVPRAGQLLADLGADVTKLEAPPAGDPARRRGPFSCDRPGETSSLLFCYLNRNKSSLSLNLESGTGRKILTALLDGSDLLIHDRHPTGQASQGLAPEQLARHARLVSVAVTPWGERSPYRDYRARSLVAFHAGGLGYGSPSSPAGMENPPPLQGPPFVLDYDVGYHAAIAAIAGVMQQRKTGAGLHLDLAAADVCSSLSALSITRVLEFPDDPPRVRGATGPGYLGGIFPCNDGHIQLRLLNQANWSAFREILGSPPWTQPFDTLAARQAGAETINTHVAAWLADKNKYEAMALLQSRGVIAAVVQDARDFHDWEQTRDRGFFQTLHQPEAGPLEQPAAPYRMSRTPVSLTRPAPRLGQHNHAILTGRLGYSSADVVALRRVGII